MEDHPEDQADRIDDRVEGPVIGDLDQKEDQEVQDAGEGEGIRQDPPLVRLKIREARLDQEEEAGR